MVWKTWTSSNYSSQPSVPRVCAEPRPMQQGNVIAVVGNSVAGRVSRDGRKEHVERLARINDEILAYNLDGRLALMRDRKNDRQFDRFIAMPFTKGVTERESGRTLVILGSSAHHIEAMQGQFNGVVWTGKDIDETKKYGSTIRWINVGNTREGFIGLDYNPLSARDAGTATSMKDVSFLARTLIGYGYDKNKKLYLLNPPYITEREEGKSLRARGFQTIKDYMELKE